MKRRQREHELHFVEAEIIAPFAIKSREDRVAELNNKYRSVMGLLGGLEELELSEEFIQSMDSMATTRDSGIRQKLMQVRAVDDSERGMGHNLVVKIVSRPNRVRCKPNEKDGPSLEDGTSD